MYKSLACFMLATLGACVAATQGLYILVILAVSLAVLSFVANLKVTSKNGAEASKAIEEVTTQLRTELEEAHTLARSKFAESELSKKVLSLLIDAGKHLGSPPSSRGVQGSDWVISYRRDGLKLVAEANALLNENIA